MELLKLKANITEIPDRDLDNFFAFLTGCVDSLFIRVLTNPTPDTLKKTYITTKYINMVIAEKLRRKGVEV